MKLDVRRTLGSSTASTRKRLLAGLAAAALSCPSLAFATVIQYDISVEITAAPTAPGSFASNPWSFVGPLPQVFTGTFDADDTVAGPISNLALTIGGLDIAATHTGAFTNAFDPTTLLISFAAVDPSGNESAVVLGDIGFGTPTNYAVAVENSVAAPVDPFLGNTQNWVGTVSISAATVPEPATLALLGMALVGIGYGQERRRNRAARR